MFKTSVYCSIDKCTQPFITRMSAIKWIRGKYLWVIMHADFKINHRNYPLWIWKSKLKRSDILREKWKHYFLEKYLTAVLVFQSGQPLFKVKANLTFHNIQIFLNISWYQLYFTKAYEPSSIFFKVVCFSSSSCITWAPMWKENGKIWVSGWKLPS